jgi:hypothetical protein
MKKILAILLIVSVVAGCNLKKTNFKEVKGKTNFTMQMPEYLTEVTDLNADASLQYSNTKEEVYLIVIDDSKEELKKADVTYTLQQYFDFAAKNLEGSVSNYKLATPVSKTINGNKALVGEITGKFQQYDVYYKIGAIESPKNFYQVVTWTMGDKKDKYAADMDTMIESLKEN